MAGLLMIPENGYQAGLKMLEDLTKNAHEIQEKILEEILKQNGETEYLKTFLHGQIDKQLFKKNVPIVNYEDIKPYIDRIVNGELSQILLTEPIIGFNQSSGTSGGQPKLVPCTTEYMNNVALILTLMASVLKEKFEDFENGKRMYFSFGKPGSKTPSGLMVNLVSANFFTSDGFRKTKSSLLTSPIEAIVCPDSKQAMYCQLLAGLLHRYEVVCIGSIFAAAVLRGIKCLEDHWKEMCVNIKTGQISNWITDSGCKHAVSLILKPDPELANAIESICCCKSWEGIIKKLWPRAKFIEAIATGSMSQYTAIIDFYSDGLRIVSPFYASSETMLGINTEPLNKPSDVSYTFLPNMAYFEFIPVKKDCGIFHEDVQFDGTIISKVIEDFEPVDLVNVELGQCYQLLVTTSTGLYRLRIGDIVMVTGFHNNAPQFRFIGREGVVLSIDDDLTSEDDLLKAITKAKVPLDLLGLILASHTSYADTSSIPGRYVLFWELKTKAGNDIKELDPNIMIECCSIMEDSLDYTYKSLRKENRIAALEIRVVKDGTFDVLMDYFISQGSSINQYKTPSSIKSKEAMNILDSKVVGRFFSLKSF